MLDTETPAPLPQKHTLMRYFPIVCTLIIGVAVSFYMYSIVDDWGHTNLRIEFESRAKGYSNAVQNTLKEYLGIPEFIKDFHNSSQNVTRKEFSLFATRTLSRYPGVQALSWNPLVKDQVRPVYESEAIAEGFKDFMFTERSNMGKLVQAGKREEYVVVYFIEPLEKNRPALGFDIASDPVRLEAIKSAFDTGKPVATARITLVQETGNQFGTLILNPIYQKNAPISTIEDRRKNREGLVVEVLRIGDAIEKALSGFSDEGIILYLYDVTSKNENHFLYTRPLPVSEASQPPANEDALEQGLHLTTDFDFAGRQWKLILVPSGLYLETQKTWTNCLVLSVGLCLTVLLAIYLFNRLKSEERHRTILQTAIDGFWLTDTQGRLLEVNETYCRMSGYNEPELLTMRIPDLEASETIDDTATHIQKVMAQGEKRFESRHRRKDGSIFDVEISIQYRLTEGGRFMCFLRDITDRKQAEEEQKKLQAQLSNAMEIAHLGHWEYDIANDLFTFNDHFYRIFRTTAKEVGEYTMSSSEYARRFVHPDDIAVVGEETRKAIEADDPYFSRQLEHRMLYADGTVGYISVRFFIVKDTHGRTVKTYGVNQDITKRKLAEEQIKASLEEKEVLLSEIHHRVKNNMQVIISLLRLQADKIEDKKYADMFTEAEDRIRSMSLIHEQLYQTKDLANINFREYIKTLSKELFRSYVVDPNKIKLNVVVEDIAFDLENAMPCGLIINELVSNSLQYAFPEGREGIINIELRAINEDELELTVSDNGVGIPEELDIRNTDTMGLYLFRLLAEHQLGGKITLKRTQGTQFTIKFKRATYKLGI